MTPCPPYHEPPVPWPHGHGATLTLPEWPTSWKHSQDTRGYTELVAAIRVVVAWGAEETATFCGGRFPS
eukprot:13160566-Alexandrium_andersonii.AAC.1